VVALVIVVLHERLDLGLEVAVHPLSERQLPRPCFGLRSDREGRTPAGPLNAPGMAGSGGGGRSRAQSGPS